MKKIGWALMILGGLTAGYFLYGLVRYNDTVKGRLTATSFAKSIGPDQTRRNYLLFTGVGVAAIFAGAALSLPGSRKRRS